MAVCEEERPRSLIFVLQEIEPQHCDAGGALIFGELLRWADLATCASAEAHTRSHCVTGEVTDLVLEKNVVPMTGDILELHCEPVIVGNTSLVIGLHVELEKANTSKRVVLCSAQFTYITMKGSDGVRPKCPPLERPSSFAVEKKSILAKKSSIVQQLNKELADGQYSSSSLSTLPKNARKVTSTLQTMMELVLPEHANHMQNTFGGQVMYWMHKIANITARRHAKTKTNLAPGGLWTTAVEGIRFVAPSKPSDHLIFNALVRRVFPPNHIVVWVQVFVRSIADGKETEINTAFFHLAAFQDHVNGKPYIVTEVASDEKQQVPDCCFS